MTDMSSHASGSTDAGPRNGARSVDGDARLTTIRNLLAKAEATTFPAEAEAFTAKATELMARHRIDEALVWARDDRRTEVPLVMFTKLANMKSRLANIPSSSMPWQNCCSAEVPRANATRSCSRCAVR